MRSIMSILSVFSILLSALLSSYAMSRDGIQVVGSSTVYPFSTVVAERYGRSSGNLTPTIESTGSGGGMKLFCSGVGVNHPDITNSSRRMKKSEFERCMENGVEEIIEVQIGYDGIVIANAVEAADLNISRKDLFLALAEMVPTDKEGELIENPYTSWKEVNSDLPDLEIEVLGPPPTSGTRDAFAELGLEGGCKTFDWIAKLKKTDKNAYKQICHTVREDGHYVEAGENDNLIVQKLNANPDALGIFGFSFLDQNADKVKGSKIESISPTFDSIADKSYSISRPLYFYVKKAHIGVVPGIKGFLREFTSERAWGEDGYLADKGMIPLPEEERFLAAKNTRSLTAMTGKEPLQ